MAETFKTKVKRFIFLIVRKITGHEYDCCEKWWQRCRKCHYVVDAFIESVWNGEE